jgi:hypothetical protein
LRLGLTPALGVALLPLVLLLAGCSRAVAVPDPAPTGADLVTCTALMADLPDQVLDQDRRRAEPGNFSAAWGDPAITLRCGVAKPPELGPASTCLEANGVGWFGEEAEGGRLFTTIGRQTYVELAVPSAYAPESGALVDVAATVAAHNKLLSPCV